MTTITADDIRVLARSPHPDAVLALVDDGPAVLPGADVAPEHVVYTRADLLAEFGEDITDIEADVLAAGLTADHTPG